MGMDADVIVIGPFSVLVKLDVLEYPMYFYGGVQFADLVLGFVAGANTTDESHELAKICGVEAWDLGNHQVKNPVEPIDSYDCIGEDREIKIYELLVELLKYDNIQLWYRPNG